jgi:nucleoside-triphosphatase THEP1
MLAGIAFQPKHPIDDLLAGIADTMLANGKSVAGYVQKRRKDADCGTLVHVRNLRSGDEMPITKNRGKMAKGCKLDGDALSTLAAQLARDIEAGSDILIIARFGRSEADGHGLRDVISRAMELEIPILVGVRDEYHDAWDAFHGGYADALALDEGAIKEWLSQSAEDRVAV